jgi:hypothetical protein
MLITILSYFQKNHNNEDYYDDWSTESPTVSIVRDSMSATDNGDVDGWEQVSIPISVEEDYEIVTPLSDFSGRDDAATPTATSSSSSSIFQRVREWRHQRSLQRNQLGLSITETFAELSKEDPNQMEEEAIQRAMELSMLDVALVHSRHFPKLGQQQQPWPHDILGVAVDASPTEIKTAYRKLAKVHVSNYFLMEPLLSK